MYRGLYCVDDLTNKNNDNHMKKIPQTEGGNYDNEKSCLFIFLIEVISITYYATCCTNFWAWALTKWEKGGSLPNIPALPTDKLTYGLRNVMKNLVGVLRRNKCHKKLIPGYKIPTRKRNTFRADTALPGS